MSKFDKVAWRGKKLSAMTREEALEALYEVYTQRKTAREVAAHSARTWESFDRAFERLDKAFGEQSSFFQRIEASIRRGARFRL